ncbi:MAG: methylenetetrahydrofolate reductase [Chloroflexi bacterium]|nr:methylenetetrahydrofolate reductase [Chloroflexota bacterium]
MHLSELIRRKGFVVTCEIDSPKGVNIESFLDKVDIVEDHVDAISVSDNERAVMRAGPLAICHLLKTRKLEAVMQLTTRDRNRIALQSDMLAAAMLGVENIIVLSGYHPSMGDHVEAKPVYDLDCVALLRAANALTRGEDMSGHTLDGAPSFCYGVTASPGLEPLDEQVAMLKEEVSLGACFIQTQTVYDPTVLERFMESVKSLNVPVIVGHMMLKSASMASFLNSNVPGVNVPDKLIRELEGLSKDKAADTSMLISIDLLKKLKPMCQGIHFIPAGWERCVPVIMEALK